MCSQKSNSCSTKEDIMRSNQIFNCNKGKSTKLKLSKMMASKF